MRARFDRWYAGRRIAALNLEYRVASASSTSTATGRPARGRSLTLPGSNGRRHVFASARALWLPGNRVMPESQRQDSTRLSYAAEKALVGGSSVVHGGQQRFFPAETRSCSCGCCCSRLASTSAMLCSASRSAPPFCSSTPTAGCCGRPSAPSGELTLKSLPRGDYRVSVDALGISSSRPIALPATRRSTSR